ncbi:Hypothetical Protein FCC1311_061632 [Hondaea fermentalgiana]|uniref:Cilia- and flagella-associated protein 36 n=1 Tax=Hondaea fermentalgiana TaxID=2315210 RepID=A0A2R5GMT6_9STRA|nr:Hypothetical Protein FCC1311_061632 [Hondaea fermentalgiana]|eukprot:GBG29943.1 Hypothetical Protein FCC1311_061632 [Hondaea fermentalgiana]
MQGEGEEDLMEFMVRFSNHVDGPEFNKRMAKFFRKHCHIVDLTTSEHSLEMYELYQTYQGHIDNMLEDFVDKEGLPSAEALVAKVRAASEANSFASEYVQFILDVVDYESFAKCMQQYWRAFARNNGIDLPGEPSAKSPSSSKADSKSQDHTSESKTETKQAHK